MGGVAVVELTDEVKDDVMRESDVNKSPPLIAPRTVAKAVRVINKGESHVSSAEIGQRPRKGRDCIKRGRSSKAAERTSELAARV